MQIGLGAGHAAPGGALDEALLHQERLDDVLDRVARLGDGVGQGLDPGGAAGVVLDQGAEIAAVEAVETLRIDVEAGERRGGGLAVDDGCPVGGSLSPRWA